MKRTIYTITALAGMLLCFLLSEVSAQKYFVKGVVIDKDGSPVPFATVVIKAAKTGTQTDIDGKFSVTSATVPLALQFSAVSYQSRELKLKAKDFTDSVANVTVTMNPSSTMLSEVVVVGAGMERETSSYAYSPGKTLSGKVSGVSLSAPASPSIRIRGASSLPAKEAVLTRKDFKSGIAAVREKQENRSSLLTAGEVNDFKKWKMWEDYNETDFKAHSEKWKLFATQRYSVQLQNENAKAIVGEAVYLIDRNSGTVTWTAWSDNTGKVELWNGLGDNSQVKDLAIKTGDKIFSAIPFSQGINHITLKRNCAASSQAEIAFVVDATGSMADEIDYLKEELGDILAKFSMKDPSLALHTGAVFYRDKGDEYVTRIQPFSANISNTINFIKAQSAGGGGDYPEAVKEALEAATDKLNWSATARTKIIFLLMDAPPHDEARSEMASLIAKAAAKGIRIVPVACSGTDKATEFILRSIALATNGTYLFLTDDSGIGNAHIKPTTDEFKVELLNDLLLRVMEQMCFVNACGDVSKSVAPISLFSNPENVKVFPNPSTGPVTIETGKVLKEIFVTDFTGKIVMRLPGQPGKTQYTLNLSAFPSAAYLIRYITTEGKTGSEKIIINR